MSLTAKLKSQTRELHQKAHESKYFQLLFRNELSLESFVTSLRGLAIIHGTLERILESSQNPIIQNINKFYIPKLPLLSNDLFPYERQLIKSGLTGTIEALQIADDIMLLSQQDEMSLLGYLYILEGSTNGAKYNLPHIKKNFNVEPDYFICYGDFLEKNWIRFSNAINEIDEQYHDSIINGAKKSFTSLLSFYENCYQITELVFHPTIVNYEAGNHNFPDDPFEIEASIATSHTIIASEHYYKIFGERGIRFAKSDNGWLLSLCEEEQMEQQLMWLLNLLAKIGLPTILLEKNLIILHEYIIKLVPNKKQKYDKLLDMASYIKSLRNKIISEEKFLEQSKRFSQPIAGIGKLILCAYIDEKNGFSKAVEAIMKKLESSNYFSKEWFEEVHQILETIEIDLG